MSQFPPDFCSVENCSEVTAVEVVTAVARRFDERRTYCKAHSIPILSRFFPGELREAGVKSASNALLLSECECVVFHRERYDTWLSFTDDSGCHQLAFASGITEGNIIAALLEGALPNRLVTHELISRIVHLLGGRVEDAYIRDVDEQSTYYASMRIMQGEQLLVQECRPTDAYAVALATGCPFYIVQNLCKWRKKAT
jgi:bifunctional DNase/RNase